MNKNITILVDNINSWIVPFAQKLNELLNTSGYNCKLIHSLNEIVNSDVMFILGCEKIIKRKYLNLNKHNIVIHESDLPQGKGWSPLTWQIIEGKSEIPLTLFEAQEEVDSGQIYLQDFIKFKGTELNEELKKIQGEKTIELCILFLKEYDQLNPRAQTGPSTYYERRSPKDSQIDITETIQEQFNLLRVCDNERYPAYFYHKGKKYILKIYEDEN